MAHMSIPVVGPRELPEQGLVTVWFDTGSGPGYQRQVWAQDLRPAFPADDQSSAGIYRLSLVECDG